MSSKGTILSSSNTIVIKPNESVVVCQLNLKPNKKYLVISRLEISISSGTVLANYLHSANNNSTTRGTGANGGGLLNAIATQTSDSVTLVEMIGYSASNSGNFSGNIFAIEL